MQAARVRGAAGARALILTLAWPRQVAIATTARFSDTVANVLEATAADGELAASLRAHGLAVASASIAAVTVTDVTPHVRAPRRAPAAPLQAPALLGGACACMHAACCMHAGASRSDLLRQAVTSPASAQAPHNPARCTKRVPAACCDWHEPLVLCVLCSWPEPVVLCIDGDGALHTACPAASVI